uniref:Uncharacterized protein n=1 Tax=Rhizophora mucronata TaxID=61149 RepID=A0A2P2QJB2_RHIMU
MHNTVSSTFEPKNRGLFVVLWINKEWVLTFTSSFQSSSMSCEPFKFRLIKVLQKLLFVSCPVTHMY